MLRQTCVFASDGIYGSRIAFWCIQGTKWGRTFFHARVGPVWIRQKMLRDTNEVIPSIHSSPNETTLDIAGPITRSRAKQLEKEIHSQVNANLMFNNQITLNERMLLSTCFNVLRNDGVHEQAWDHDDFCPPNICREPGRA
jgi:hypothetical protein